MINFEIDDKLHHYLSFALFPINDRFRENFAYYN